MRCLLQSGDDAVLLLDYCERKLDPALAFELEQHIAVCPDCARIVEAQQAVWNALDDWQPAPISADFNERVWRRIEAENARPWWRRWLQWGAVTSWKPAMPLAAACMVLAAVALFQTPAGTPQPKSQPENIDVEQVETTLHDLDMLQQLGAPAGRETPNPNRM